MWDNRSKILDNEGFITPPMQHWRWLWIWVGVLVAGCSQAFPANSPQSPTREPTQPLFGYTLLPPSLTPAIRPLHTPTPYITLEAGSFPYALYLMINGPACYETSVGSLICMGQVHNQATVPVDRVRIEVQLLAQDGMPLVTREIALAQNWIPAGGTGPFRVLFETIPADYAGVYAFIKTGEIAYTAQYRYANLVTRQIGGTFTNGQYQVTLSISNYSTLPVTNISVLVTLLNPNRQVTGFRQTTLDETHILQPGESLSLTIKVIPQGINTVSFTAFADGLLQNN